jgi:hypothetical protein
MIKIFSLLSLLTILSFLFLSPFNVIAQIPPPESTSPETLPTRSAFAIVQDVMRWLWTALLIVAVITIIIAAYLFITAGGNPETLQKARNYVLYALVAIILAALAWGLVAIARRAAGG